LEGIGPDYAQICARKGSSHREATDRRFRQPKTPTIAGEVDFSSSTPITWRVADELGAA
jgi:hypothetical protein